ncbi:MAG: polyprenyl synthetase family protein [Chloroflexota bacterium]|nr:polyprenyl synthetase family protein [Chloroflexota bacterium]
MSKTKEKIYQLVNDELINVLVEMSQIADNHKNETHLNENIIEHVLSTPGKQLRPTITIAVSKLWNKETDEKTMMMATAVELLHIATLVHDDTIDFADTRRGRSTASKVWGPHIAVLVGDYLFATSAEYVCKTESIKIIKQFASTIADLANGELIEIENSWNPYLSIDSYFDIIHKKTASLFSTCTMSGAILGQAKEKDVQKLYEFGMNLGLGFQIFDDILDFEGAKNTLGKPTGSDLKNGILTLPSILAREKNKNIKQEIITFFKNKSNDKSEILDNLLEMVSSSGSIEESKKIGEDYINKALENLSSINNLEKNIYMEALEHLSISSKNRTK